MTDLQEINSSDITVSTHKVFYKPKFTLMLFNSYLPHHFVNSRLWIIDPFRFIHFNLSDSMTFKKEKYKIVRSKKYQKML